MFRHLKNLLRRFVCSCIRCELEKSLAPMEQYMRKQEKMFMQMDKWGHDLRQRTEQQFDELYNLGQRTERRFDELHNLSLRTEQRFDELHSHIEITYRDIMVVLEKQLQFVGKHNLVLKTEYPCAYNSLDYTNPKGTAADNTRYPRFIRKCESYFGQSCNLSFLDLGCSGGGMVLDAIIRGHFALGLEGSDYSLRWQRAEWRLLKENLFTCDIGKPFVLTEGENGLVKRFDVITAWEVLEHIEEAELPQLFKNIYNHLSDNGIFVGSIACRDDLDKETGINWHRTVHPPEWWKERIPLWGFKEVETDFETEDMARGWLNNQVSYKKAVHIKNPSFFVVLRKREPVETLSPEKSKE